PRSSATCGVAISTAGCPPARSGCSPRRGRCSWASWRWRSGPTRTTRTHSSTRCWPPAPRHPRDTAHLVTRRNRRGHPAPRGRVAAVVPAAGAGVRLGAGVPKAVIEIDGTSMLVRAVAGLLDSGVGDDVVAVVPAARVRETESLLAPLRADGHLVVVTTGGAERTDSVRNGLAALESTAPAGDAGYDVLLVHDAARCLAPAGPTRRVVETVRAGAGAVVPVLPVVDTVKEDDDDGVVIGTPVRSALRAVQTPQGFDPALLLAAYDAAGDVATDDAGLVERLGEPVVTVEVHALSLKITTADDTMLAECRLNPPPTRPEEPHDRASDPPRGGRHRHPPGRARQTVHDGVPALRGRRRLRGALRRRRGGTRPGRRPAVRRRARRPRRAGRYRPQ